jgi:hypothetical protein
MDCWTSASLHRLTDELALLFLLHTPAIVARFGGALADGEWATRLKLEQPHAGAHGHGHAAPRGYSLNLTRWLGHLLQRPCSAAETPSRQQVVVPGAADTPYARRAG